MIAGAFGEILPKWFKIFALRGAGRTSSNRGRLVLRVKGRGRVIASPQKLESEMRSNTDSPSTNPSNRPIQSSNEI